ncbi:MAG: AAA family ATPase [Phycisphaerae bacterium]
MLTIAIVNEKGGSGKTTTTVNLAAALGEINQRVLLVDLDGQAASTRWLGIEGDTRFADALWRGTGLHAIPDVLPNVSLAPGHAKLDSVAHDLRPTQGGQLRKLLREVEDEYDLCLIDCPPSLGNRLIGNALVAATHAVVPVETSILAMDCMQSLLETIEDVREGLGHDIELMGILACRFDARTNLSRSVLGELHRALPGKVLNTAIRENVRLRECPAAGESILTFAPKSNGAEDYRILAREVVEIIEGTWTPIDPGSLAKPKPKKSRKKAGGKKNAKKKPAAEEQTAQKSPLEESIEEPAAESTPAQEPVVEEPLAQEATDNAAVTEAQDAGQPHEEAPEITPVATFEVPETTDDLEFQWDTDNAAQQEESAEEPQPVSQWNLDETPSESAVQTEPTNEEDVSFEVPFDQDTDDTEPLQAETEGGNGLSWSLNGAQGDAPREQDAPEDDPAEAAGEDLSWQFDTGETPEHQASPEAVVEEAADEPEIQETFSKEAPSFSLGDEQTEPEDAQPQDEQEPEDEQTDAAQAAIEEDDAEVEAQQETPAAPAAPTSWPTAESEFYRPILEAMSSLGGSAKEEHVLERIREIMDERLTEADLDPDPNSRGDVPTWQQTVQKAKRLLTIDGLMKEQKFRRMWKITSRGREAVANHDQERIYD